MGDKKGILHKRIDVEENAEHQQNPRNKENKEEIKNQERRMWWKYYLSRDRWTCMSIIGTSTEKKKIMGEHNSLSSKFKQNGPEIFILLVCPETNLYKFEPAFH